MIDKKGTLRGNCFSVFTLRQFQQRMPQAEVSAKAKSQFAMAQKPKGTSGTSTFIGIDGRRKYKYYEK